MRQVLRIAVAMVLGYLTVLATGDSAVRAQTTGDDFGWSKEVDAAMAVFENGDAESAVQRLTPLADAGDANAQFLLGRFHEGELGVKKENCRALQRYKEAAAQGHVAAIGSIGGFHVMGHCTIQNADIGARYFLRAARLGQGEAAFLIALHYVLNPDSVPSGSQGAVAWMERAWELKQKTKYRNSLVFVPELFAASRFRTGEGVQIDLAKSERYILSSATQGSPLGQSFLGDFYLEQPEHPRHSEAWKWIFLAALQGNRRAAAKVRDATPELASDEWLRAMRDADETFDRMVVDPSLELGRAALWCFKHEPMSKECLYLAYDHHYRCSPGIDPDYYETRYIGSTPYHHCRRKFYDRLMSTIQQ